MKLNFTNDKVDIWTKNSKLGIYAVTTFDVRLAYRLNRALDHYAQDTIFTQLDEPTFYFSIAQMRYIAQKLPYMGKILAQTC